MKKFFIFTTISIIAAAQIFSTGEQAQSFEHGALRVILSPNSRLNVQDKMLILESGSVALSGANINLRAASALVRSNSASLFASLDGAGGVDINAIAGSLQIKRYEQSVFLNSPRKLKVDSRIGLSRELDINQLINTQAYLSPLLGRKFIANSDEMSKIADIKAPVFKEPLRANNQQEIQQTSKESLANLNDIAQQIKTKQRQIAQEQAAAQKINFEPRSALSQPANTSVQTNSAKAISDSRISNFALIGAGTAIAAGAAIALASGHHGGQEPKITSVVNKTPTLKPQPSNPPIEEPSEPQPDLDKNGFKSTISNMPKMYNLAAFRAAAWMDKDPVRAPNKLIKEDEYYNPDGSVNKQKVASFVDLLFVPGWAQNVQNIPLAAGIIDGGVSNDLMYSGYYKYPAQLPSLSERLKAQDAEHMDYKIAQISGKKKDHANNVAGLIKQQLAGARFVNLLDPLVAKAAGADEIDLAASIDAASAKGVRFFNRSLGTSKNDITMLEPGNFLPAVGYHNALVVNAAGNVLRNDFKITQNALPPNSPLKDGWIIVSAFAPVPEANYGWDNSIPRAPREQRFSINIGGIEHDIYPQGNSCKAIGADDCIAAPWVIIKPIDGKVDEGTSYAAPLVTATAMGVYAKYPFMSASNIKETLFSTAYKVSGGTKEQRDAYFGVGVINPVDAINGPAEFRKDFIANVDIDDLFVFSNDIKGSGGLIKKGVGTLALGGQNTFKGASKVEQGALWVTRNLASDIDVSKGAQLRLGVGSKTQAIKNAGDLISDGFSASSLELAASSRLFVNLGDVINVAGVAKLDGEIDFLGASYDYMATSSDVRVLNAQQRIGEFSSVAYDKAFLQLESLKYDDTGLSAVLAPGFNPTVKARMDDYAKRNYAALFASFEHLQKQTERNIAANESTGPTMSKEELKGAYTECSAQGCSKPLNVASKFAIASWLQNLSSSEAIELAPRLFAANAYKSAAGKIANSFSLANMSYLNAAFIANTKTPFASSSFGGSSVGLNYGGVKLYAALADGSKSALGFGLNTDLNSVLNASTKAMWLHQPDSNAVFVEISAKAQAELSNNTSGYLELGAQALWQNFGGFLDEFAYVNRSHFNTFKARFGGGIVHDFGNLNLEISALIEHNFKRFYEFDADLFGVKIKNGAYILPQNSVFSHIALKHAANKRTNIVLDISTQFARYYQNATLSMGVEYSF